MKLPIVDRFKALWAALTPTDRRPRYNPRAEPLSNIQYMDVDRVRAIIDGAQSGDTRDLFALYRDLVLGDSHLQAEFSKRKLAVLGDVFTVKPIDKKDPKDVAARDAVSDMVDGCPEWLKACSHLLDSALYPIAVAEKVFKPAEAGSSLRYELAELRPVPHNLLNFNTGYLQIWDVDPLTGFVSGTSQTPDPNRYIIHRGHLLTTPDFWGGPMRSLIFWSLFSVMDVSWWARFLDRYGSPFLVGKYDQADDESRLILERAFSWATKIGGLVVSKETEVTIQSALGTSTGEAYEKFLEVCNREKSKLIVGQTLSAEARSTGLGSGVAKGQSDVRDDIRALDAKLLAQTLRDQLSVQYLKINGLEGKAPKMIWGSESPENLEKLGTVIANLASGGIQPADSALEVLGEKLGFEVQRTAVPAPALSFPGVRPYSAALPSAVRFADAANEEIARASAATLSQAFRGSLAPVRRIILESRSQDECEARIKEFYADWKPDKLVGLLEEALTAYAANGAVVHARD